MRHQTNKTRVALTLGLGFALALAATARFASITKVSQTTSTPGQAGPCNSDWPAYRTFVEHFVQADGRVIDYSSPQLKTTSEGQSYGLFFALVANDRATFDRLLNWIRTNLAGNQFDPQNVRLPSWFWGKKPDGSFGVLDQNSASDSDLWIVYDLLQAGRLWHEASYTQLGQALAAQIARQEMTTSTTGTVGGEGPLSYWGALAPYFKSLGDERGLGLAHTHLAVLDSSVPGREPVYYDRVLGLFGTGFIDGRYRFDEAGRLVPSWRNACD